MHLLVASIDSIVSRLSHCTANSLRSDHCNFCRLLTPQTCRTIAEVKTCHRGSSSEPPEINRRLDFNCTASARSLPSHRSLRLKTPGYELWAFSSLMNWASNAGDRGDSLISVSRWQIFIEFWTEISLYFLPWITEILAPMAPVYEGKMVLEMCCFFPLFCAGLSHYQSWYNWIAADTEGEMRCTLSSFNQKSLTKMYRLHVFLM